MTLICLDTEVKLSSFFCCLTSRMTPAQQPSDSLLKHEDYGPVLPTHWDSPCHIPPPSDAPQPGPLCCVAVAVLLPNLFWERNPHFGRDMHFDRLPGPVRRDQPFPKTLQQSQAGQRKMLFPHSRTQSPEVLNVAPISQSVATLRR